MICCFWKTLELLRFICKSCSLSLSLILSFQHLVQSSMKRTTQCGHLDCQIKVHNTSHSRKWVNANCRNLEVAQRSKWLKDELMCKIKLKHKSRQEYRNKGYFFQSYWGRNYKRKPAFPEVSYKWKRYILNKLPSAKANREPFLVRKVSTFGFHLPSFIRKNHLKWPNSKDLYCNPCLF